MKQSSALGRTKLAIERLASKYPLHAGILAQWSISEDESVGTMGVGYDGKRLRLIVCPTFAESVTMGELEGVLHHESNHVLFDHVLHKPGPSEDRAARTIAQEVTVNEWVPEPLPGQPVLLTNYPHLPPNEETDTRYDKLRGKAQPDNPNGGGQSQASAAGQVPPQPSSNGVPTVDNHGTWADMQKNAASAKSAIDMDVAEAWNGLTGEQKGKVGEPFASIAEKASESAGLDGGGHGVGSAQGSGTEALAGGTANVPWQTLLRRHAGKILERRPVFGRVPRRFPELAGVVPGKGRFASKPKVMAVIDTSGSMSAAMLADISAELGVMARHFEVVVVECDASIQAVYPYKPITDVHGRGGTDFRPPLAADFLKLHRPDLVVYFTDGGGPAPCDAPTVPVLWCITEGGRKPASWGREVDLHVPEKGTNVPENGT
jgi:predicted metal-dependent peptidase